MMRFVILAAMVACAVADSSKAPRQRNKLKKFAGMVNPFIEGSDAVSPTGVFVKGATFPIPRTVDGYFGLDLELLDAFIGTPARCPQDLMIGNARLTVQNSVAQCTMEATFIEKDSSTGSVKETIVGTFNRFTSGCIFTRNGIQYNMIVDDVFSTQYDASDDAFGPDNLFNMNNTGYMIVSSSDGQSCLQPYSAPEINENISSFGLHFEPVDTTYDQLTIYQTTQGYYRLGGNMLIGTGAPQTSQENYDTTTLVNLDKHTGFGISCPKGPLGEFLFNFTYQFESDQLVDSSFTKKQKKKRKGQNMTPLQGTEGYRGCASIVGLGGSQFGGLFSDFGLDRMDKISFFGFSGLAPWVNRSGYTQKTNFAITMFQIDYNNDAWIVISIVEPEVTFNNMTVNLLDINDIFQFAAMITRDCSLSGDVATCNGTVVELDQFDPNFLANDITINLYIRIAGVDSNLVQQRQNNKNQVYAIPPSAGKKGKSAGSYKNKNKKQNRRKRRKARKINKYQNRLDFSGPQINENGDIDPSTLLGSDPDSS